MSWWGASAPAGRALGFGGVQNGATGGALLVWLLVFGPKRCLPGL